MAQVEAGLSLTWSSPPAGLSAPPAEGGRALLLERAGTQQGVDVLPRQLHFLGR